LIIKHRKKLKAFLLERIHSLLAPVRECLCFELTFHMCLENLSSQGKSHTE